MEGRLLGLIASAWVPFLLCVFIYWSLCLFSLLQELPTLPEAPIKCLGQVHWKSHLCESEPPGPINKALTMYLHMPGSKKMYFFILVSFIYLRWNLIEFRLSLNTLCSQSWPWTLNVSFSTKILGPYAWVRGPIAWSVLISCSMLPSKAMRMSVGCASTWGYVDIRGPCCCWGWGKLFQGACSSIWGHGDIKVFIATEGYIWDYCGRGRVCCLCYCQKLSRGPCSMLPLTGESKEATCAVISMTAGVYLIGKDMEGFRDNPHTSVLKRRVALQNWWLREEGWKRKDSVLFKGQGCGAIFLYTVKMCCSRWFNKEQTG